MHVTAAQCNFQYVNFDHSVFNYIQAKECDFGRSTLSACTFKEFSVKDSRFVDTNLFQTRLRGMDFTQCELAGITVSDTNTELEGAIVTSWQAVELARLLKVVIKE